MRVIVFETDPTVRQSIAQTFSGKGWQVFETQTVGEFRQVLAVQGRMLDLALVRRESRTNEDPLSVLTDIRQDQDTHDLPVVILHSAWSDAEAAAHQASPEGAHAYLKLPLDADWFSTVDQVLGLEHGSDEPRGPVPPEPLGLEEVLVFEESPEPVESEFKLDAPFEGTALLPMDTAGESAPPAFDFSSVDLAVTPQFASSPTDPDELPSMKVEPGVTENDPQVLSEMPYLFSDRRQQNFEDNRLYFGQPVGNAVVPGGMSESPDEEVLKRYLMLREQDVSVLSAKVKDLSSQNEMLTKDLASASKTIELQERDLKSKDEQIKSLKTEYEVMTESHRRTKDSLDFELQKKTDALRVLEKRMREAVEETDRIREQVKLDIRKIRVREKELESKLEIVRKDSEVLIYSRESKIVELKRKLDLMEYNYELLQEQLNKEKAASAVLREKLSKAAQAMRVAEGVLDVDSAS